MVDIHKEYRRYIKQSAIIFAIMAVIVLALQFGAKIEGLISPLLVSLVFSFGIESVEALVWRIVAEKHADSLINFFTAVSGFRMLLALVALTGCYLVVGRDAMLEYCLVFLAFYAAMLVHHSWFFSRVSHSHNDTEK